MHRIVHFEMGNKDMKQLLGGKGANLAEMTNAGLPVPPGYTVTTEACREYFTVGNLKPELIAEINEGMKQLEGRKGQKFGDPSDPLLVSVRSGSVQSMPGMMDTILNLGLNDATAQGLAAISGDERFAMDCYRRFIQMFSNVVFNIDTFHFENLLHRMKEGRGVENDQELSAKDLQELIGQYKELVVRMHGKPFPQNVMDQLHLAVESVFRSWNNQRAVIYRNLNKIPHDQGTAVNIQAMVFGNRGQDSGTGVLFTRNPSTGENKLFGEFLIDAQGEDVVAGIRTPQKIDELEERMPELYKELLSMANQLERHYRDVQDIEFTFERGRLFLLQTRNGKRTAQAAVRIAVDLAKEGMIKKDEALMRLDVSHLNGLMHPTIEAQDTLVALATGLPASPGAASGQIVFDADTAEAWGSQKRRTILVRTETTPEDIHGVIAAEGVLTCRGGMTSHAAVVARGMGKSCVCGCESIRVDSEARTMQVGDIVLREGDWLSIDGGTGKVYVGEVKVKPAALSAELLELISWADEYRRLKVLANADNPQDAAKARELGAEGVGLCRTEHMFFGPDRLPVMQAMIMADTEEERKAALQNLLPMQQSDFEGIFKAMDGLPVTIRLLDPPLHEFLPHAEELTEQLRELSESGAELSAEAERLRKMLRKVRSLQESNPMLGLRGCRLGILFPEVYTMQAEAVFRAVVSCAERGVNAVPQIMIPLVGHVNELAVSRKEIEACALNVIGEENLVKYPYEIGTMIEVPRAALTAHQIAEHADFFSFGTNDLTQMTFGYSRDDAEGKFLHHYTETGILPVNPFEELDQDGVGQLIELAVSKGKALKPGMKTGVCGEHGGDKASIIYCDKIGLDYVSCSPFRVPLARIAAAQANIMHTSQA